MRIFGQVANLLPCAFAAVTCCWSLPPAKAKTAPFFDLQDAQCLRPAALVALVSSRRLGTSCSGGCLAARINPFDQRPLESCAACDFVSFTYKQHQHCPDQD